MLALTKRGQRKVRIDRILLRSDAQPPPGKPASAKLLGIEAVSAEHPKIFPSDHFGVAATIVACARAPAPNVETPRSRNPPWITLRQKFDSKRRCRK